MWQICCRIVVNLSVGGVRSRCPCSGVWLIPVVTIQLSPPSQPTMPHRQPRTVGLRGSAFQRFTLSPVSSRMGNRIFVQANHLAMPPTTRANSAWPSIGVDATNRLLAMISVTANNVIFTEQRNFTTAQRQWKNGNGMVETGHHFSQVASLTVLYTPSFNSFYHTFSTIHL